MSHSEHSRPRQRRQVIEEWHGKRQGRTRAQRADQGRAVAIAESLAGADDASDWLGVESDLSSMSDACNYWGR